MLNRELNRRWNIWTPAGTWDLNVVAHMLSLVPARLTKVSWCPHGVEMILLPAVPCSKTNALQTNVASGELSVLDQNVITVQALCLNVSFRNYFENNPQTLNILNFYALGTLKGCVSVVRVRGSSVRDLNRDNRSQNRKRPGCSCILRNFAYFPRAKRITMGNRFWKCESLLRSSPIKSVSRIHVTISSLYGVITVLIIRRTDTPTTATSHDPAQADGSSTSAQHNKVESISLTTRTGLLWGTIGSARLVTNVSWSI